MRVVEHRERQSDQAEPTAKTVDRVRDEDPAQPARLERLDHAATLLRAQAVERCRAALSYGWTGRRARDAIPHLTAITGEIETAVRQQYEENPYPRWVVPPSPPTAVTVDEYLRSRFPLAPFRPLGDRGGIDVLVAGCGTGEHSIGTARRYKSVKVLAIDLSLSSLTYAKRKTRELGLPTWDAPAAPCLSSRVRYGLSITPSRLKQVEESEAFLRALGVAGDLRVRHLGDVARVEVEPQWIPWIEARRATIIAQLRSFGFAQVEIDPRGYRRGSLLESSSP